MLLRPTAESGIGQLSVNLMAKEWALSTGKLPLTESRVLPRNSVAGVEICHKFQEANSRPCALHLSSFAILMMILLMP